MKFDIFLSLCQAEVDRIIPSEQEMYRNFFSQVRLADALGFDVAWVGESHFSSTVQKQNPSPVIPHFNGEVALNTDVLHLAPRIFRETQRIAVGAAIRNIFCNGGPLAHAEAVKMFLSIHGLDPAENRKLHLGFASGRFAYSNRPYGISPRTSTETLAWPELKVKLFLVATEVFLRGLKRAPFSSADITPLTLRPRDFADPARWQEVKESYVREYKDTPLADEQLLFPHFWQFEHLAVVPFDPRLSLLDLTIGTYDAHAQELANTLLPTKVFNLSFTDPHTIEATHLRMQRCFHPDGGAWARDYLPRTSLVFIDAYPGRSPSAQNEEAKTRATKALDAYWRAMQGTVSATKIDQELSNALWGNPDQIIHQIKERFHQDDRLMCWFDFCNHDNALVSQQMKWFMEKVVPFV
jgi:hypothetical protein